MAIADGQKANAVNLNAAFADKNFKTIASGTNLTIVNNQAALANITGLIPDKTLCRSIRVEWQVYRKSTGGGAALRVQRGAFLLWHDDTDWHLTPDIQSGVDAGVAFDLVSTTTGQVGYTSDNQAGTYAAGTSVLSWEIVHTMRL